MEENPPLPDLHHSEIDKETLEELFLDIGTHARVLEIIPKYHAGHVSENPEVLQLDEAFQQLVQRRVEGMQIRYLHEGVTWWDTLMPMSGGLFRIVRIQHHFDN